MDDIMDVIMPLYAGILILMVVGILGGIGYSCTSAVVANVTGETERVNIERCDYAKVQGHMPWECVDYYRENNDD